MYFGSKFIISYKHCQYFLPVCGLPFHFLYGIFINRSFNKIVIVTKLNLSTFLLQLEFFILLENIQLHTEFPSSVPPFEELKSFVFHIKMHVEFIFVPGSRQSASVNFSLGINRYPVRAFISIEYIHPPSCCERTADSIKE